MSDMLGNDDQDNRKDDHDRLSIKFRWGKMRHSDDLSCGYFLKINNSADDGCCIACQNCDQDWDNCQEFAEQDGTEYSYA